ncbi:collagen alpha-1(XVIII) chain-like [Phascolarctos cinereus]
MAPLQSSLALLLLLVAHCPLSRAQFFNWWTLKETEATVGPLLPTSGPQVKSTPFAGPTVPSATLAAQTGILRPIPEEQPASGLWTQPDPEASEATGAVTPLRAPPARTDLKEENIAGVGAKILNVAQGIRSLVQFWDEKSNGESSSKGEAVAADPPATLPPLPSASGPGMELRDAGKGSTGAPTPAGWTDAVHLTAATSPLGNRSPALPLGWPSAPPPR